MPKHKKTKPLILDLYLKESICIFVSGRDKARQKPVNLVLDGKQLPWVESAIHLGHIFHESGSMEKDIRAKRASFIDNSVEIRETFEFASPSEVLNAVKLYVGSHNGSMLWDLGGDLAQQYYNAWNVCVRLAWQVPRATHTYFVEQLLCCGLSSTKADILARYSKFIRGLIASPSKEVAVMYGVAKRDIRTVTGSNIALLVSETELDPTQASLGDIKKQLYSKAIKVPEMD